MIKSVKAIILASVMVSMSVMLINGCGVSSPTSSNGGNPATSVPLAAIGGTGGPALNTASKSPLPPILADPVIAALPSASIADILKEPHANPNASSPNKKPYKDLCGNYMWERGDQPASNLVWTDFGISYSYFNHLDIIRLDNALGITYLRNIQLMGLYLKLSNAKPYLITRWSIPSGLFPPDFMLPDDFFTGSGFPDGIYIIGGMMYEKGTDANGNPTVKPPVPVPVDPKTGQPLYPPGYYPPAEGTNLPATQPPGTNNPPTGGTNPPPASGATLVSLTIYTNTPTIAAGAKPQLNVIGVMSDGSTDPTVTNSVVVWHSDNMPVATIDNNGLATTLIEGTANIWATYNNLISNPIPLTVTAPDLMKITISPANASTSVFDVAGFTAYGSFSNNTGRDMTNEVSWSSGGGTIVEPLSQYLATYPTLSSIYSTYMYDYSRKYYIGLSNGTTTISAASGTIVGTADITVGCRKYDYYCQLNYPGILHDHSPSNSDIATVGCALSNTAMILSAAGVKDANGNLYKPDTLNTKYNENYNASTGVSLGFDNGTVNWQAAGYRSVSNGKVKYVASEQSGRVVFDTPLSLNSIDAYLNNCQPVIVGVRKLRKLGDPGTANEPTSHYVLVIRKEGNDYIINDPVYPLIHTLAAYNNNIYNFIVYSIN